MTTQLIVRVDKEKKERFERMARRKGKTTSEAIRDLMDGYVERHDMRRYLLQIVEEFGVQLKKDGYTQKDVPRIIKEVRAEKRKKMQ